MIGTGRYIFSEPTESEIELFWSSMASEGLHRIVLYHKANPSLADWHEVLSNLQNIVVMVSNRQNKIVGMFWINRIGLSGVIHYAILKDFRKEIITVAKIVIDYIFINTDLVSIIASWPSCYRFNNRIIKSLGFKRFDSVFPKACHMPTRKNPKRYYDMNFAVLKR